MGSRLMLLAVYASGVYHWLVGLSDWHVVYGGSFYPEQQSWLSQELVWCGWGAGRRAVQLALQASTSWLSFCAVEVSVGGPTLLESRCAPG